MRSTCSQGCKALIDECHSCRLREFPCKQPTILIHSSHGVIVRSVSCGHSHSIALDSDGRAYTWGSNSFGQLGNGTFKDSDKPKEISYHMDVTQVCAYGNSTAIVDDLNNLLTFGSNSNGQLGISEPLKARSFDNCYTTPQKVNRDLILQTVLQLYGCENTFGFLTNKNEIYVCGEFCIPIAEGKAPMPRGLYAQNLLSPTPAGFLRDARGRVRHQIKRFALNS